MSALKWQSDHGGKIGRVFLRNKESGEKVQVESAYFSNLDYRWHDIDGNVHPMYEKYLGKPYAVQFRIQNSDGKGNLEPFEGELKLSCKIGERGFVTPEIVAEGKVTIAKSMDQVSQQRGLKGLIRSTFVEKMKYHIPSAFFNPGKKVEENITTNACLPMWFFFDKMEGLDYTFKELMEYMDYVAPIIYLEKDPIIPDDDPIAMAAVAVAKIYAEATSHRRSVEEARPLFESLTEGLEAVCIKMSTEWKEICSTNSERMMTVQQSLRKITVFAFVGLEMRLFELGYSVSKKVRNSFWYKMMMDSFGVSTGHVNDMLSYHKEAVSNTLDNNIVYCHIKSGASLNAALKKVMDISNSAMDNIDYFGGLMLDQFRGTEDYDDVEKFVNVTRGVADTNIQVYPNVDRYHKDLVYDCIVDEITSSPA